MNLHEIFLISPEIILFLTLLFVVVGEITYFGEQIRLVFFTAAIGLASAFVQTLISYQHGASHIFYGSISIDGFSLFFKLLFILSALLTSITSWQTHEISESKRSEFYILILSVTLASCLAVAAANMFLIFLAFQIINISNYFIVGYGKKSVQSTEAAIKYMMFSLFSVAFFLNAIAIFFVSTHTLNIYEIHKILVAQPLNDYSALVAFAFLFMSFAFQMAVFPMHLWAPDVLQGAPTPASGFLSFVPRIVGFAVLVRVLLILFAQPVADSRMWTILGSTAWPSWISIAAGGSMLAGSMLALRQESAKRMIGSLLLLNSGAVLMGLLVLDSSALAAAMYSFTVDLFAIVGIFYILTILSKEMKSDTYADLRGALSRHVVECLCLVMFLLSLVGIPPAPGFIAKFGLIGAAVQHHWYILAAVAVVSITFSFVAVGRFIFCLIGDFKSNTSVMVAIPFERRLFLSFLMFPIILVGIFAERLLNWAGMSLGFIFW